jgi:hypothetical protein
LAELQTKVDEKLSGLLTTRQKTELEKLNVGLSLGNFSETMSGASPGTGAVRPGYAGSNLPGPIVGFGDFGAPPGMNPVFRAHRYGTDYAGLAGKSLEPRK